MNTVLQWAQERGFDSMELFTAPALQEAVRLYERYGFVRVAGKTRQALTHAICIFACSYAMEVYPAEDFVTKPLTRRLGGGRRRSGCTYLSLDLPIHGLFLGVYGLLHVLGFVYVPYVWREHSMAYWRWCVLSCILAGAVGRTAAGDRQKGSYDEESDKVFHAYSSVLKCSVW